MARVVTYLPHEQIDAQAWAQVQTVAALPFVARVAVMPDCHVGKGATIGSVIGTRAAIIPAAVGVDIGCGMIAVHTTATSHDLPDSLAALRGALERAIPHGVSRNNARVSSDAAPHVSTLRAAAARDYDSVAEWELQLGSLGSGNHFLEVCLDESDDVWVVLHSGSRGIGNTLAAEHIRIAQRLCAARGVRLVDRDLAYFQEKDAEFARYIRDVRWAQAFAQANREIMMDRALACCARVFPVTAVERINCHHNFTQEETHGRARVWVTRKGAIEARRGQRGIIPGSMGTRSYIVEGLGNEEAYCSAPHGAGRRLSRGAARRAFSMRDFDREMQGVECRRSSSLIDELPSAYKDIETVMEQSRTLVTVRHVLKQVLSMKGD